MRLLAMWGVERGLAHFCVAAGLLLRCEGCWGGATACKLSSTHLHNLECKHTSTYNNAAQRFPWSNFFFPLEMQDYTPIAIDLHVWLKDYSIPEHFKVLEQQTAKMRPVLNICVLNSTSGDPRVASHIRIDGLHLGAPIFPC